MSNPRILIGAGVALTALVVIFGLSLAGGGGTSDDRPRTPRIVRADLALERFTARGATEPELLVSLTRPALNTPAVTGGARLVSLRCFDDSGTVAIRRVARWPLVEEPGYLPHIHQPASRRLLESIRACRLTGPGIDFEGQMASRLPTPGE